MMLTKSWPQTISIYIVTNIVSVLTQERWWHNADYIATTPRGSNCGQGFATSQKLSCWYWRHFFIWKRVIGNRWYWLWMMYATSDTPCISGHRHEACSTCAKESSPLVKCGLNSGSLEKCEFGTEWGDDIWIILYELHPFWEIQYNTSSEDFRDVTN